MILGPSAQCAAVAIGRNEGARLERCLASLVRVFDPVVYVDSGSTDSSIALAKAAGAEVVELSTDRPFSAARGRNAGMARVLEVAPETAFVQFVDGDCELVGGWAEAARGALVADESVAVVCGRRRERNPEASVYNRLCDLEWDTPIGEADACGGDALMRVSAFQEASGFNESIVAGEEPDFCLRLRLLGHRILRIDQDMTLHDAAIFSAAGWWTRVRRGGHAAAEGWFRHREEGDGFMVQRVRSALFWGLAVPLAALVLAPPTLGASILAYLGVAWVQVARTGRGLRARGRSAEEARLESRFLWLGKPAEASGVLQYAWRRLRGKGPQLIEYKGPSAS